METAAIAPIQTSPHDFLFVGLAVVLMGLMVIGIVGAAIFSHFSSRDR